MEIMTKTPRIIANILGGMNYLGGALNCEGLTNLVEVNAAELTQVNLNIGTASIMRTSFKNCTELVYLRFGNMPTYSFDLTNCLKLDIPTLETTLMNRYKSFTGIVIMLEIWNQLSQEVKDFVIAHNTVNIKEN